MALTKGHLAQLGNLRNWARIQGEKQSREELPFGPEGSAPGNDTGPTNQSVLPKPKGREEHRD